MAVERAVGHGDRDTDCQSDAARDRGVDRLFPEHAGAADGNLRGPLVPPVSGAGQADRAKRLRASGSAVGNAGGAASAGAGSITPTDLSGAVRVAEHATRDLRVGGS